MIHLNIIYLFSIATVSFGHPVEECTEKNTFECKDVINCASSMEVGEVLILSNYLKNNDTKSARTLSIVDLKPWSCDVISHSGYINVDKNYNSNLFFWYFPVKDHNVEESPLVIWLQGGPGISSLHGLFEELGPFSFDENSDNLVENPYSWHKKNSLLFIDNPVGSSFSFTNSIDGYAKNQTIISDQLYKFLTQFLQIFPEVQKVPLYITGQSYAGKHIPSFANVIHKRNPTADVKINLKGIAIGNGFTDPESFLDYSTYFYQLGLIDETHSEVIKYYENETKSALEKEDYVEAYNAYSNILQTFEMASGLYNIYNYVSEKDSDYDGAYKIFVQRFDVRKAIHVGNTEFKTNGLVTDILTPDLMKSAKTDLEESLEHYKVMLFSGQLDLIIPYQMSSKFHRKLNWSGSSNFLEAKRKVWYYNQTVIGYTKKAGNLLEVLIRNAGHSVPSYQSMRSELLINSFINDLPFQDSPNGR